jgi:hypothetical protein
MAHTSFNIFLGFLEQDSGEGCTIFTVPKEHVAMVDDQPDPIQQFVIYHGDDSHVEIWCREESENELRVFDINEDHDYDLFEVKHVF